jgi:uncharacterized membrane protein YfcA
MRAGPLRDLLVLLLGVLTGLMSALFGVGGAVISNPGLRTLGASPLVTVGTTLPSILPGAVSGTLRYRREGLIAWPVVAWAGSAGVAAVVGGSLLSHAVPGRGHLLLLLIAALLGVNAWRTATGGERDPGGRRRRPEGSGEPQRGAPVGRGAPGGAGWRAALVGVAAGLLSGLLGVGGGVVLVPGFTELADLPFKSAIATSLVCVGIFGVPGTVTHALLGDVDWRLAALLTVGVVPGARLGANLTIHTAERRLRVVVACFLGVLAVVYGVTETRALLAGA